MRLYVIARHGESTLNFENRVNGDPSVPVHLTEKGQDEARLFGRQLAHIPVELCIHTRFSRTRETAALAQPMDWRRKAIRALSEGIMQMPSCRTGFSLEGASRLGWAWQVSNLAWCG